MVEGTDSYMVFVFPDFYMGRVVPMGCHSHTHYRQYNNNKQTKILRIQYTLFKKLGLGRYDLHATYSESSIHFDKHIRLDNHNPDYRIVVSPTLRATHLCFCHNNSSHSHILQPLIGFLVSVVLLNENILLFPQLPKCLNFLLFVQTDNSPFLRQKGALSLWLTEGNPPLIDLERRRMKGLQGRHSRMLCFLGQEYARHSILTMSPRTKQMTWNLLLTKHICLIASDLIT